MSEVQDGEVDDDVPVWKVRTCSVAMPQYRMLKGDRVGGSCNGEVTVTWWAWK